MLNDTSTEEFKLHEGTGFGELWRLIDANHEVLRLQHCGTSIVVSIGRDDWPNQRLLIKPSPDSSERGSMLVCLEPAINNLACVTCSSEFEVRQLTELLLDYYGIEWVWGGDAPAGPSHFWS